MMNLMNENDRIPNPTKITSVTETKKYLTPQIKNPGYATGDVYMSQIGKKLFSFENYIKLFLL